MRRNGNTLSIFTGSQPSCYMYIFINSTDQAVWRNATRQRKFLELLENATSSTGDKREFFDPLDIASFLNLTAGAFLVAVSHLYPSVRSGPFVDNLVLKLWFYNSKCRTLCMKILKFYNLPDSWLLHNLGQKETSSTGKPYQRGPNRSILWQNYSTFIHRRSGCADGFWSLRETVSDTRRVVSLVSPSDAGLVSIQTPWSTLHLRQSAGKCRQGRAQHCSRNNHGTTFERRETDQGERAHRTSQCRWREMKWNWFERSAEGKHEIRRSVNIRRCHKTKLRFLLEFESTFSRRPPHSFWDSQTANRSLSVLYSAKTPALIWWWLIFILSAAVGQQLLLLLTVLTIPRKEHKILAYTLHQLRRCDKWWKNKIPRVLAFYWPKSLC